MRVTLTFDLPEERQDMVLAMRGPDYFSAVCDYAQDLRNILKYDVEPELDRPTVERLRTLFYQALDGLDLEEVS